MYIRFYLHCCADFRMLSHASNCELYQAFSQTLQHKSLMTRQYHGQDRNRHLKENTWGRDGIDNFVRFLLQHLTFFRDVSQCERLLVPTVKYKLLLPDFRIDFSLVVDLLFFNCGINNSVVMVKDAQCTSLTCFRTEREIK